MSYNNKQYNTRFSGRYNTPGQFVSPAETYVPTTPRKQPQSPAPPPPVQALVTEDVSMEESDASSKGFRDDDSLPARPHWMKSKLPGVKKVSNKERRRRQNENLRRLLTPKNALMVLNEMMPNEQVANQFKVEASLASQCFQKGNNPPNFCADLTIDGNNYKGYGDNKLMARNAAAEQAIRDLMIKKMNKIIPGDSSTSLALPDGTTDGAALPDGATTGAALPDEAALPMIQLASFALHKLFSEWEYDGHKVPQLKPTSLSTSEAPSEPAPKKSKELPPNATSMHPCMLLTYMRPHLEYREVCVEGDRPQNIMFTMGVEIDGDTYIGKASNKKEARKLAAASACDALYGVTFEPQPQPQ